MRKDELIASVQKLIVRQNPTQDSLKFAHPKVVEGEIAKAYRTLMVQYYSDDENLNNAELDFYAKKYRETIKVENGQFYIDLPVKPIDLRNGLGMRYVKPVGGYADFVRMKESELSTIRNLSMYCCMGKAFYYLDGKRIVFDFPVPEHRLVKEVDIKVLPNFNDFDDDDDIQFPSGDVAAMQMILEIMGIRPTDNINDDVR